MKYVHEDYMKTAVRISLLRKRIKMAVKVVKKKRLNFDSIAFRGMSGAMLGTPLALRLNKQIIMVRKSTRSTHSSFMIEGFKQSKQYLIVDDFVSNGNTVRAIMEKVRRISPKAKCIGILEVTKPSGPRFIGINSSHMKDIL